MEHAVCTLKELGKSWCKIVAINDTQIVLFLVEGQVRAYRDLCPHAGAPLSGGSVRDGVVRCPWHGWEFNLKTGAHAANPRCTLDAYRAEVRDGTVFVWV